MLIWSIYCCQLAVPSLTTPFAQMTNFIPHSFSPTGLIIHEGSSVYRIFKRWQAVNQQWKVLNYDKAKDLGEPIGGSTKPGGRNSRTNPSSGSERTSQRGQRVRTILNHHCGYTILHILSHLRPNEHRGGSSSSREVVMRVTTV